MGTKAELLFDDLTTAERDRADRVEAILPALAAAAGEADATATFPAGHVRLLGDAGLLGLVVPSKYGGLDGGLRDLVAATFAMGTACPSTALAYFFHNSSASRGLLALEAIEAGLLNQAETAAAGPFAEKLLNLLGSGQWMANFASESVKSSTANITISTSATPHTRSGVDGWLLNGVKSFGCATGVADKYLVTASIDGGTTADHLGVFMIAGDAPGTAERQRWDAIGMRASATHGITLHDVWVAGADALALPGVFVKMMQMSRGSFVGSQVAGTAVYVGAASAVYDFAIEHLTTSTFADSGQPIGTAPFQQQLIGEMRMHLDTALMWLRRQVFLESAVPPPMAKADVVRQWRIAKGTIAEAGFGVSVCALKACGTSHTNNSGMVARMLRDLSMGLVQAFPPEKGRLEAASMIVTGREQTQFGARS